MQSLQIGQPLPNSLLSTGDHICVGKKVFLQPVYVKIRLDLLGYDSGLWEGLEHFSGQIMDRYYPMFTVQFGGSIGLREVKVCDSILDSSKDLG